MIHILEVVLQKKTAFWIYTCLLESVLPLNFYTNTLYPQTFLEYTIALVKEFDNEFFVKCGDSINMFCLKSYYSLFTNLQIDEQNTDGCQKSEMAYFMLDLLFLIGDSKRSSTIFDNPLVDGHFFVGEKMKLKDKLNKKQLEEFQHEPRVRIDRTSQLLISMSITIAEKVKMWYLRSA